MAADEPVGVPGRNIEIKARLRDRAAVQASLLRLGAVGPVEIAQDDTFFHCRDARLKLRDFGDGRGELILYRRSDDAGSKESSYLRSPTSAPQALRDTLATSAGVSGRVVKQRTLWKVGRTRVHLDRVEGLGDYLELEVVLQADESAESGHVEARRLMAAIGIADADCVAGAYVDLLGPRSVERASGPTSVPASIAATASTRSLEGGCYCGAVRYSVRAVFDAGYCHCTICRRISGAGAACWFSVREEDFHLVAGAPVPLASSAHFMRYFCAACGTHLYGLDDQPAPARVGSRLVSAMLGTLDQPEAVAPRLHQWWQERVDWFGAGDTLPKFATGTISHPDDRAMQRSPLEPAIDR